MHNEMDSIKTYIMGPALRGYGFTTVWIFKYRK